MQHCVLSYQNLGVMEQSVPTRHTTGLFWIP